MSCEMRIAHIVYAIRPDASLEEDLFVYADPDDAMHRLVKERERRGFQAARMKTVQLCRHDLAFIKYEPAISDAHWDEYASPGLQLVWRAQA